MDKLDKVLGRLERYNEYLRGNLHRIQISDISERQIVEDIDYICREARYSHNMAEALSDRIHTKEYGNRGIIIDVNSRRSGKTTRLINNVLERLVNDQKSIIVCMNHSTSTHIMGRIRQEIEKRDLFGKFQHHREDSSFEIKNRETVYVKAVTHNSSDLVGYNTVDWMFHYDEFDFYIDDIEPYYLQRNGYYCTTPRSEKVDDIKVCIQNLLNKLGL